MFGDENRNSLLATVIFRPLYMRKWLDYLKSASNDVNDSNSACVNVAASGQNDDESTFSSSYMFKRLKEFCTDENINFEKWITLKSMKGAFFGQTVLSVITGAILAKANQQNMRSFPDSNISNGLRKCLTKSIFSGAAMAVNIGFIMISITEFARWREYFSIWTIPCATTVIPAILSYSLSVKPLQAIQSGLMLGVLSSLAIFSASLFYDLSTDEIYQCVKNNIEIELKKERESELYRFMKEHHIRSKWFGKWMLNRSRVDDDIDDDLF
ncbi:unnamed protein product [Brugia timori]|uniref:Aa_trans domain-containing protein n=1 Tax=Brugia timori TaxID=42155 RepID=A0A0R3QMX6_9BILA|nr:unnamed protein product [Brugia timori]